MENPDLTAWVDGWMEKVKQGAGVHRQQGLSPEGAKARDYAPADVKILTIAHVPESLQQAWLQHLRDFDVAHPGCYFEMMVDAPEMPLPDIINMLAINPGLTFTKLLERK